VTNDGVLSIYSIEAGSCTGKVTSSDFVYGTFRLLDADVNGDLEIVVNTPDATRLLDVDATFGLSSTLLFNGYSAELGVVDMNNDGYSDVFITRNDHTGPYGGYNIDYPAILRNEAGNFSQSVTPLPMVPHYPVTFVDYDNDTDYDAHIGSDDWIYNGPEKVWLLRNAGNFSFPDNSQGGMYYGLNYYGHIEVLDVENDGDYDYFQQMGAWQGSRLLINNAGNYSVHGSFEFPGGDSSKGCGLLDYDDDGDLDVLFSEHYWFHPLSHFSFYRNESQGSFLTITPISHLSGLNTYGIRLVAYINGRPSMPPMQESVYGFTRQFNIGMGSATQADSLVIMWPGGEVTRMQNIAANQFLTVYQEGGGGTVGADERPMGFALQQNSPNPFNPTTLLRFTLEETGPASLQVFNIAGQHIATLVNGMIERGPHELSFDACHLPAGIYIYTLKANGHESSRRMTLVK
jgi:hypothetical protein